MKRFVVVLAALAVAFVGCNDDKDKHHHQNNPPSPYEGRMPDNYGGSVNNSNSNSATISCQGTDGKTYDNLGTCDENNKLRYCNVETEKFTVQDCNEMGLICGFDSVNGYFDCLDGVRVACKSPDHKDYDNFGVCEGNKLMYCNVQNDIFTVQNCTEEGRVCGDNQDSVSKLWFKDCLDPKNGRHDYSNRMVCNDDNGKMYDDIGVCDGNTAKYCNVEGGSDVVKFFSKDCGNAGCGPDKDGFMDCKGASGQNPPDSNPSDCGNIDIVGVCEGNVVKFCDNNELQTKTCSQNESCRLTKDGYYDCVTAQTGCGSVTVKGICDGDTLKWCDVEHDTLVTEDCSVNNQICATSDAGDRLCYDQCGDVSVDGKCDGDVSLFCGQTKAENEDDGIPKNVLIRENCTQDNKVCAIDGNNQSYCKEQEIN